MKSIEPLINKMAEGIVSPTISVDGATIIHVAATVCKTSPWLGRMCAIAGECAKHLIPRGSTIDKLLFNGSGPHSAVDMLVIFNGGISEKEMANCVWILVSNGAPTDVVDELGRNAMHYALRGGLVAVANKCFEQGYPALITPGNTHPIHHAATASCSKWCLEVLGNDVNVQDDAGRTPLIEACYRYQSLPPCDAQILFLLKAGADLSIKDGLGMCALDIAATKDDPLLMNLLSPSVSKTMSQAAFGDIL